MKKYILTIDQGTTSSRAILFDKNGETKAFYQMEFTQITRKDGYVEHNANEIFETVLECIKNVIQNSLVDPNEIDSIAIANQRETAVMFDLLGNPLCDAICWQSKQSEYICDELVKKGYSEIFFDKTGLQINPYFSASKIRWMLDNHPHVKKAYDEDNALFGTIDTYLLYRLTNGKSFYTDATNASRTLLYNIHTLEWDDELINIFGIKKSILPKVLNSSDFYGDVDINGINVPVMAMVGDQQAAMFGHCAYKKGDIKNTYGTGCFMLLNTADEAIKSKRGLLTTIASMIDGKVSYALEGSVFIAGAGIKWLRDSLRIIEKSSETEARALKEASNDVIIVPSFVGMGTPYWDNDVRGAMFGLTLQTSQESIIKATLQSIAYQSKDVMEVMKEEAGINSLSLSVDGGASANNMLMQFQSDIMQTVIKRPRQIETTALGACFLAGLKTGFFSSREEIEKLNQIDKMYYPIITNEETIRLYARWKKAVEATRLFK